MLYEVAIIEPAVVPKFQGDESRPEQLILAPIAILAASLEAAKTAAIVQATSELKDGKLKLNDAKTDARRWEVLGRPFKPDSK